MKNQSFLKAFVLASGLMLSSASSVVAQRAEPDEDSPKSEIQFSPLVQDLIAKELFDDNVIRITGDITPKTLTEVSVQLRFLDKKLTEEEKANPAMGKRPIKIILNSEGGRAEAGAGIVNIIKLLNRDVHTIVEGSAMSIAMDIFVAGKERLMLKSSLIMQHPIKSSGNLKTMTAQDKLEAAQVAAFLTQHSDREVSNATGLNTNQLRILFKTECFMDARSALSKGFATGIIDDGGKVVRELGAQEKPLPVFCPGWKAAFGIK